MSYNPLMLTLPQLFMVIGLFSIAAELFIGIQTGFDLVLIGSILTVSGLVGSLTTNTAIALILATVLNILYIFFGRKFIKKKIIVITHSTNIDKLIGATGVCIRSITPDTAGLVRLSDEDWRASSDEIIYEKDKIKVISIEGVTLKVQKNK